MVSAFWPDGIDWITLKVQSYAPGPPFEGVGVFPIACHSHNDYWRPRPLFTALEHGCSAIEADVWLSLDDEVLVGHNTASLSLDRTLSTLYLNPIVEILDRANPQAVEVERYSRESGPEEKCLSGVFDTAPQTSLVLLIDFKSNGSELWPAVHSRLDPLRRKGYLTYFNGTSVTEGPVTVVVSGNACLDDVVENVHYRDMFLDAPLELMSTFTVGGKDDRSSYVQESQLSKDPALADGRSTTTSTEPFLPTDPTVYDATNSFYASASFKSSVGYPLRSKLTRAQMALMRSQIRGAHARGLKVRYWGVPSWPIGLRNYLWRVMVREGVDFLSVDDVRALAQDNWGPRKGGWGRKWWF